MQDITMALAELFKFVLSCIHYDTECVLHLSCITRAYNQCDFLKQNYIPQNNASSLPKRGFYPSSLVTN
jgi:hypothetical protein